MNGSPLNSILSALVVLALLAVLVSKSSKTSDAIGAFFGLITGLVSQIMQPLNSQKGA